ncbi:FAD-binding and (Fe-S)-binding domain-containing protein [Auraticoccus monumenti]|uniref:FAD/FMN-containing dehydrogenase n=1 Tax=Auraticoccus monumenti TaxID=675864 RepID=A0A1G7EWN5_9ACTN|nr:FAD-binding and (Fe-S)-binding domain-containing protein [Auraticoccus monumenti]SDE68052.1 FAD/FMN-containing dehydrogenase [Auraticoccus monumenti]
MTNRALVDRELGGLAWRLDKDGVRDVIDTSTLARSLYSSDASLYRVVPRGVAVPRSTNELEAVLDAARERGVAVTLRGGGTSCAGNAVGPGLVVDVSRHLNRVISVDPEQRAAVVEPGVIQSELQKVAAPHGLRFGPDPSTHNRCTLGGMIGNNACGPRALGYGKTADNVLGLEVVAGNGERLVLGGPDATPVEDSPTLTALRELVASSLGTIRTQFGRFGRQVSGYSLEHLLPENGFDVARFLAGTEGTLVTITRATVRLVADPPHRIMVALGYASMADAADDAPTVLAHAPTACEGLDSRIVDVVRRRLGDSSVPAMPEGEGWMLVELADTDPARLATRAALLLEASHCLDGLVVADQARANALWKIREDGAGLAGVSLGRPAYPGWEDAAVPPEHLGEYLRAFDDLLTRHGLRGLPYGHFGDGCVHVRIDFPLTEEGGAAGYREFVTEAATLVASFGGSMSGEHGDGRARSALLPSMYSPEAIALFGAVKQVFDPAGLLNPGVLVDPRPVDADLRAEQVRLAPMRGRELHLADEVHRCSGVGKCIADTTGAGGVMCPSYQATRQEKDSTRGRARVLQEMVNGTTVKKGFRSPEVHEALDLCLSCKGCRRDCPTGVDMAAYKSRVLDETYKGGIRPRSHYALGWLPRWGRLITRVPGLAAVTNAVMATPGLRSLLRWGAGVDQRRQLPRFATTSATRAGRAATGTPEAPNGPVVLWVDSFSDFFDGPGADPMVQLLRRAGYDPQFLPRDACCGLTWISTGQLDGARRQLRSALDVLHPVVSAGTPVVGMEPSCLAVWRSDAPELLPDDPRVADVATGVLTLAELLARTPGWTPPDLSGTTVVAQPHCHHASVLGWKADAALLASTGAEVTTVGGCCGLAGNFGVEQGHYEVSVKVAEHDLLPAVRAAGDDALVLADGFSCRTQLAELADRRAVTLPELLLRGADDAR